MTSQSSMNISINNWNNYCDDKCAYSFKYTTSSTCTVKSYGSYLYLNYDSGSQPPVTFNGNTYNVDNIEIYSPSLHLFNGVKQDGEVIITHKQTSIGGPLIVCIPLSSSNTQSTEATQIITDIINGSSQLKNGDSINIKLNDYNLNNIVPLSPFYYYEESNGNNIIVYGLKQAISINASVILTLQTIITPFADTKYPAVDYYYFNKYGPSMGDLGDGQIYIDCQPTGNSEDTTQVEYSKSAINNDLGSILNSKVTIFIISVFIIIVLLIIIYKLLLYLTGTPVKKAANAAISAAKGAFKKQ